MTEQQDTATRERDEIVSRIATFKATQERFEREREEYYATTLGNAWSGFGRTVQTEFEDPPLWS